MSLREIKKTLKTLNPGQLLKLDAWLQELIAAGRTAPTHAVNKRPVVEEGRADRRNYRLQGVRCGKENCKCVNGELHGPYWYAYWSEGGSTRSQYVGKELPAKKKR